jgi:hypothetical protein
MLIFSEFMITQEPVKTQTTRHRSMNYPGKFYVAIFWTLLHLFCMVATLTALALFLINHKTNPSPYYLYSFLGGLFLTLVTLAISIFKRRAASCPLCRGTPLLNSGALTHKKSSRLRPLNHGFTALLRIVFTQKMNCMYCGTNYDLLKTSSHSRSSRPDTYPHDPSV